MTAICCVHKLLLLMISSNDSDHSQIISRQNKRTLTFIFFAHHHHQCFSKYAIIIYMQLTAREADYLYSLYGAGQHVVRPAVSRPKRESESAMTRERLNRLWARPFDSSSSSSCIPSWARRRRKRRRWKEAVGRKEGYTKYGGKRGNEKELGGWKGEKKRSAQRGWDEKFSLASLRCLYTRGSCMAMGHISVSRERGAPPKNQIECKNRINSSCKLESYVRPGWFSLEAFFPLLLSFSLSLSFCFFSFSHTLYLKLVWSSSLFLSVFFFTTRFTSPLAWLYLEKRPITSLIFSFIFTRPPEGELCG